MKSGILIVVCICLLAPGCGSDKPADSAASDSTHVTDTALGIDSSKTDTLPGIEAPVVFSDMPKKSSPLNEKMIYFRDKYAVNYTEENPEDTHIYVLDRFEADKKYKLVLRKKFGVQDGKAGEVFPVATVRGYIYKDSAQCANAVNNWLNCFGNDCNAVTPGEETTIQSTPGFYILNPTSIVCLDYPVEHSQDKWDGMVRNMKKLFLEKTGIQILVKPGGRLSWPQ